jgi:peroxiredoxin
MPLPVGTQAPDFTVRTMTADGAADFKLSDHIGKQNIVLLFFPGAFTHVCKAEMCRMSDESDKYANLNALVCGVSVDTFYSQDAWAKQENITIPLLSDFQHEVTRAYDVVWPNFSGMGPASARAAFVIDKSGTIVYAEQCPTLLDQPDYDAIERALAAS